MTAPPASGQIRHEEHTDRDPPAGLAGLLLAVSVTLLGASPSGAAETYSSKLSTWTIDHQHTYNLQDLAAARIARVGITPIAIP